MASNLKEQLATGLSVYFERLLAKIEGSTGLKREWIIYGTAAILALYLILGHGAELLCNFIGFAYPAYASLQAIDNANNNETTQWLTYWTVFATISLIDFGSNKIIGWIPIYWLAKCILLLWLYLPYFRGAERLHTMYIGPAFKRLRRLVEGRAVEMQQQAVVAAEPVPVGDGQPPMGEQPPMRAAEELPL